MSEYTCRKIVRARSGGMCECCGRRRVVEMHHRVNEGQGGQWVPSNILDTCIECHRWITIEPAAARQLGWHLYPTDHPTSARCRVWGRGWVYLTDIGTPVPVGI